jgi:O-antigen/teichoic acid export membrane protein
MLLIREVAGGQDLSRLPAALLVQLILSAALVALAYAAAPALPGQGRDTITALRIYSLALFPLSFYTVFTSALRGRRRMDLYTLLNLAAAAMQVAVVWLFVRPGGSIVTLAALLLGAQLAAALVAGILCVRYLSEFRRPWSVTLAHVPGLVRASAPIALLGLLGMLYQKLSIYLLATLAGAAMTGWFSAALRVVEASKTGHLALFGALYPAMAQGQTHAGDARWTKTFTQSWKLLMVLAALAGLVMFLLASPLVRNLYGPAFGPSAAALKILAWILIPYTINTYLSLAFVAAGQERAVAYSLLASLIALAVLSAWWVPRAGVTGASAAALAAEVVQSIGLLLCRYRFPIGLAMLSRPERAP